MPLIACPDCSKQVSSFAPTCPQCGYPVAGNQAVTASSSTALRNCPDCVHGQMQIACYDCGGRGESKCPKCFGQGEVLVGGFSGDFIQCNLCHGTREVTCRHCNGSGNDTSKCDTCNGTGQLTFPVFDDLMRERQEAAERSAAAAEQRRIEETKKKEEEHTRWLADEPKRKAEEEQRRQKAIKQQEAEEKQSREAEAAERRSQTFRNILSALIVVVPLLLLSWLVTSIQGCNRRAEAEREAQAQASAKAEAESLKQAALDPNWGIRLYPVGYSDKLGLSLDKSSVPKGSPANRAGLDNPDLACVVITKVNGSPVRSISQFHSAK